MDVYKGGDTWIGMRIGGDVHQCGCIGGEVGMCISAGVSVGRWGCSSVGVRTPPVQGAQKTSPNYKMGMEATRGGIGQDWVDRLHARQDENGTRGGGGAA